MSSLSLHIFCLFFNDTATTEIYTLSLHDSLPIYRLHDSAELSDEKDSGVQRHYPRNADHRPLLADPGFASIDVGSGRDHCGAGYRRDRPSAAVLRICFALSSAGAARHVYGLRVFAARHRLPGWRMVLRKSAALLRRTIKSSAVDLVRDCRSGRPHHLVAIALRPRS